VFFELVWRGQSPGKRAMDIAVTDQEGRAPTASAVVIRHLLLVVDLLPVAGLLGLVVAMADPNRRRIGDLVAGTLVIDQDPEVSQLEHR